MTKPATDLKVIERAAAPAPADPLAKLREPFAPHHISKLPKETKKQVEDRKITPRLGMKCAECGNWHHREAVHLDYVGHAALTDRLLDADPFWTWEPAAFGPDGLPAFDKTGGLWIRLTVGGHTRLGYGHAAGKPNQDPGAREKEVIGDALRNAAMRFGAALDLWHKGDLHLSEEGDAPPESRSEAPAQPDAEAAQRKLRARIDAAKGALDMCGDERAIESYLKEKAEPLQQLKAAHPEAYDEVMGHAKVRKTELREAAAERVRSSSSAFDISDDEIPF